jgi:hypothetical protein
MNLLIDNPILTTFNIVQEPDGLMFPDVYICPPVMYNQTKLEKVYEANEKADDKWLDLYDNTASTNGLGNANSMFTKMYDCQVATHSCWRNRQVFGARQLQALKTVSFHLHVQSSCHSNRKMRKSITIYWVSIRRTSSGNAHSIMPH